MSEEPRDPKIPPVVRPLPSVPPEPRAPARPYAPTTLTSACLIALVVVGGLILLLFGLCMVAIVSSGHP
ncbi:MAG TPA: hypothetical protein PLZ36_05805 [Armatimonadota bacterium]|nr:hypothetical protein [Armatimonadota bacterium]HOS42704.1 hypothetical protein [Armatimonadota bacterium]